ncbi:lipoprotein-releasing ABC transporter permease subunit [Alteromonas sediminis]|uniref:Lipoprotein-releasing ABC transporter permease subunit n=1 Tax=Alteromonas sediminis TaxID=2259342 RepID=A0A3N5ZBY7_9ALTE|nr:lipoprotein-releasing ABC transporter permease subunit [Alteromonas sediminis]RPJ67258.1 lipoprotein-releasing ABC transporter permease subunit [Alteromonas sediminis]
MLPTPSLFIAMRYAKSRQSNSFVAFINGFSVAGITLGLMALITVVSIMNGFEAQLKQRVLGVVPHIITESAVDSTVLSGRENVKGVMAFEEGEAIVQSSTELRGVMLQGVSEEGMRQHSIVTQNMFLGDFVFTEGQFHAVVGRALASQLGISVGDNVRVMIAGKTVYTPFGRVPSQRLVTVSGIFDLGSQVDDTVIFMHWQDVQKLKRTVSNESSQWRIFLDDAFQFESVENWLVSKGYTATSWRDRQGTLFDAVKMEKNLMFVMLLLIIAVAAFNIVSALVMVVSEKQADIAILQTQGMSPASIMNIFLINGLLNGVKGAVLGCLLGALCIIGINPLLAALNVPLALSVNGDAVPIVVDYGQIMLVVALSLGLCLLASFYPSIRAMRLQPAITLHNE